MQKNSLYYNLFKSFKLIILSLSAFLFLISFFIFIFYYTSNQIISSNTKLKHIEDKLSYYFSSTEYYSKLIINNPVLQKGYSSYYDNKKDFFSKKVNMSLELNKLTYPPPYINYISLYDINLDIIMSSDNNILNTDFSNISLNKESLSIQKKKNSKGIAVNTFSFTRPIYDYNTGNLYGYIELDILEDSIQDIYKNENSLKSYYILVDDKMNIISNSNKNKQLDINFSNLIFKNKSYIFTKKAFINSRYVIGTKWKFLHIVPISEFSKPLILISVLFLCIIFISLILALYFSKNFSKDLSSPIYALIKHINLVKSGKWDKIKYTSRYPEMNTLINSFNTMLESQNLLKNKLIDAEKDKNKLELDKINEQIKPHFLYNTLDNIYSLAILDEKETLLNLVMNLSKFYRGSLSLGNSFVRIEEEVSTIKAYLDIMQTRYNKKFEYNIHYDDYVKDYFCPKLILLPLIENSIYHGIKNISYKGLIRINIKENNEHINFCVMDNGIGIDIENTLNIMKNNSRNNAHFALKHINQILNIYYGNEYYLNFKNHKGFAVVDFNIKKELDYENKNLNSR